MRTFYAEYVQHCLRFYTRYPNPEFRSDTDKQNWNACDRAMKDFTDKERDILMTVYREGDTISDNVYKVSVDRNMKQDTIWNLTNRLERKVATYRGLLSICRDRRDNTTLRKEM